VDEGGEDFLLGVGIGAEVGVGTVASAVRVVGAELLLVLLVVVVLLHEGVRVGAGVALGTLLLLLHPAAHLSVVEVPVSLPVLGVVVVHAVLVVVRLRDVAGRHLEGLQVEVLTAGRSTLTIGAGWNW
jgi:hypothetical protein